MFNNAKPVTFLIAEDDPDDRLLIHEAFPALAWSPRI